MKIFTESDLPLDCITQKMLLTLATGEIIAHSVSDKNDADLVIDMLNKLEFRPEIIHSDRG